MLGVNVDTFPAYRQLKNAGFTEVQAEALISSLKNLNEELAKNLITREEFNLAIERLETKIQLLRTDMNSMEERLYNKMNSMEARLEAKMDSIEERTNNKMEVLAKDLTIKIGYMIAGSIGLIVALIKLL